MTRDNGETTSFGFRNVAAEEKAGLVGDIFTSVASRYDLMNDLMSVGVHRIWKATFLTRVAPQPGERLIDAAGGTGDIALGFLKRADSRPQAERRAAARAVICDANADMLKAGQARTAAVRFGERIEWICGDAERLPFPDKSFDAYTVSFGIRNVTNIDAAISEAFRVLKPGGRFFCLEFSHPITEGLQKLYDAYSFSVIPRLGQLVTRDRKSYQYLVESIRRFPIQPAFEAMISRAGFRRVKYENLSAGIVAIHSGWRI